MKEIKRRSKNSRLSEEQKALKREKYYADWQSAKEYRDKRKAEKSEYDKQRRLEKAEHIKAVNREYHNKNKNNLIYKERRRLTRLKNKENLNKINRRYAKRRPDRIAAKAAKKRAYKRNATPKWLTKEQLLEIREYYTLAKELEWLFEGQKLHVDHIVPLKGENVCGLHVPWNLQIIPAKENLKKSNKLL